MKKRGFDDENIFLTFEEYSAEFTPDFGRYCPKRSKSHQDRFDLQQKSKIHEKLQNNEKTKENKS